MRIATGSQATRTYAGEADHEMTIDRTEARKGNGGARIRAIRACALVAAVIVLGAVMMSGAGSAAAKVSDTPRHRAPLPPPKRHGLVVQRYVDRGVDPASPDLQWGDRDERGMILRGPARWDPRVDVPMGLIAYLDRGVDPAKFDAASVRETALEDVRDFHWRVFGPNGKRYDDAVQRSDTRAGIPGWAFTAPDPGVYTIDVSWGPFASDPIHVTVKLGKLKPSGVVVTKSMGMLHYARENKDYSLIAYLEYENVDPRFVDQKTRREERGDITWYWDGEGPCPVRSGFNQYMFTPTKPGTYNVWARWSPPGSGAPLKSNNYPVRVVSEFTGKYMGSVQVTPKPGQTLRLSKFEFTVDDLGKVEGIFGYGDSGEYHNGTFTGKVEEKRTWPFGSIQGHLNNVRAEASVRSKGVVLADAQKQQLSQAEAYLQAYRQNPSHTPELDQEAREIQAVIDGFRQLAGETSRPEPVVVDLLFTSEGGLLNARGKVGDQAVSAFNTWGPAP